jgi:hypothetical protein
MLGAIFDLIASTYRFKLAKFVAVLTSTFVVFEEDKVLSIAFNLNNEKPLLAHVLMI